MHSLAFPLLVGLIILALAAVFFGTTSLSQATLGVGILSLGCLFAILARIGQAAAHHKETLHAMAAIERRRSADVARMQS